MASSKIERSATDERNWEIRRLREEGSTYVELGRKFNISTARAREIYMRTGRVLERAQLEAISMERASGQNPRAAEIEYRISQLRQEIKNLEMELKFHVELPDISENDKTDIWELKLRNRFTHALMRVGVKTVGDAFKVAVSPSSFPLRNFGETALTELALALHAYAVHSNHD